MSDRRYQLVLGDGGLKPLDLLEPISYSPELEDELRRITGSDVVSVLVRHSDLDTDIRRYSYPNLVAIRNDLVTMLVDTTGIIQQADANNAIAYLARIIEKIAAAIWWEEFYDATVEAIELETIPPE